MSTFAICNLSVSILRTVITSLLVKLWKSAGGQNVVVTDNVSDGQTDGNETEDRSAVIP